MMNDEIVNTRRLNTTTSRVAIDIAVLIAAILATQFVTGGFHRYPWTWMHFPAIASIVLALWLHFGLRQPSPPPPTVHRFNHGLMLIILALSVLTIGARLVLPFAPDVDALNNLLHGKLREIVAFLCSILAVIVLILLILSRPARISPVFWLTVALSLVLVASTVII